jgi:hypothetical protein
MCAQSLESGGDHSHGLQRGIFWSILLLLGTFFGLAGALILKIVLLSRPRPGDSPPSP